MLDKKPSSLGYCNHKPPSGTQVHQLFRHSIQDLLWNLWNESKGFHPHKKSCQAIHTEWSRNHRSKDITEFFIEVSQCLLSRGARYTENVLVNSFTSCWSTEAFHPVGNTWRSHAPISTDDSVQNCQRRVLCRVMLWGYRIYTTAL